MPVFEVRVVVYKHPHSGAKVSRVRYIRAADEDAARDLAVESVFEHSQLDLEELSEYPETEVRLVNPTN